MRKILLTALAFCSVAFAQQKPTIAVVAVGEGDPDDKEFFVSELEGQLMKRGYAPVVRDSNILAAIGLEHIYMRSGAVSNKQIVEAGEQLGAKCMCVVQITKPKNDYGFYFNTSIVDVKRAVQTAKGSVQLMDFTHSEIREMVPELASDKELFNPQFDMCGQRFGTLEVKPAFLGDVGKDKKWSLSFDGKPPVYSLGNDLPIGKHKIKLGHECYSDINTIVEITKDIEVFSMPREYLKLREGLLDLNAVSERDRAKAVEGLPIYANGQKIGRTPFSGSVPICSKIEIGDSKKALEDLILEEHNRVRYTHQTNEKPKSANTYIWAAALNAAGLGLLYASYKFHKDADKYLSEYNSLRGNANYDEAYENLRKAEYVRNGFLITGILSFTIGGFLWF